VSPLFYKQRHQFINGVREIARSPGRLLALLVAVAYVATTFGMIIAVLLVPVPDEVREIVTGMLGTDALEVRLQSLRGALALMLLFLSSIAAFRNPLLEFGQADTDILFATPVPIWLIMLNRVVVNHVRAFFAGFFFWGLAIVPLLRIAGYQAWPAGIWALVVLTMLFASVDQALAALQMILTNQEQREQTSRWFTIPSVWVSRVVLLAMALALLVFAAGTIAGIITGNWHLLWTLLESVGKSLLTTLLLPLGLVMDVLFLPLESHVTFSPFAPPPALAGMAVLDLATALLLVYQARHGGTGVILDVSQSLIGRPSHLDELLQRVGINPIKLVAALWGGVNSKAWMGEDEKEQAQEAEGHASVSQARSVLPLSGHGARIHIWRRWVEIRRTPMRNMLAVVVMGLLPLALLNPAAGYQRGVLLSALIFSASIGTQLFNDVSDHLRYANLELSMPVSRWRVLLLAYIPRVLLSWASGALLMLSVAILSPDAPWGDILALILWYPLLIIPMLSLRGALVFLYPAAGLPEQRNAVQSVIVMLLNGLMVIGVIMLSMLPFGVLAIVAGVVENARILVWPVVFVSSSIISTLCCLFMVWAYARYEPDEG
jgi:hypothetical protein